MMQRRHRQSKPQTSQQAQEMMDAQVQGPPGNSTPDPMGAFHHARDAEGAATILQSKSPAPEAPAPVTPAEPVVVTAPAEPVVPAEPVAPVAPVVPAEAVAPAPVLNPAASVDK